MSQITKGIVFMTETKIHLRTSPENRKPLCNVSAWGARTSSDIAKVNCKRCKAKSQKK